MSNSTDVIIIGGGVHGASLAFHLALRGIKPVVLERRFVAAGATGRSSGLVRMHYDQRQNAELAWASFNYFRNWPQIVGGACGFTRTGFIQIVSPEHVQALRANVRMHQGIGIPTMLIDADDVHRLAPCFATGDIEVAAFEPESGYADPSQTAASLMQAARDRGARLVQDCQVTGIEISAGRISGVRTTQGDFAAPIVVNAAGAWAGGINRLAGIELPYDTWRHDIMMVVRPPELGPSHPTVIDEARSMYFRPESRDLTLVGLEDGNPLGESPEGDTDHARPGFVERAIERICERIPIMEKARLHGTHSGYDGITPDQHPMLGAYGPDGFYLQCGFSGTGFKIAPAVGNCMSELILDGKATSVDISVFSPKRFDEGRQVVGEHPYANIWR